MKRVILVATIAGFAVCGGTGAWAQGTGGGPATDPTANGGNSMVNQGAGSGTGTTDRERGTTVAPPTADPTENGGNTLVNKGAGSGTGTDNPAGKAR